MDKVKKFGGGDNFPGPKTKKVLDILREYESQGELYFSTYDNPPVIDEAEGAILKDVDGNYYIDFTSGFAALNTGHRHPKLIEAAISQLNKVHHTAQLPVEVRAVYAKKLCEIAPGKLKGKSKVHFDISGTNAVEIAMKLAKAYTGRVNFISYYGGYHGRSFGTLSVTSDAYLRDFYPLMPGGYQIPFPYCYRCIYDKEYPGCDFTCIKHLELLFSNRKFGLADKNSGINSIAGLVIEPAQGASGYIIPPDEYWPQVRKLCDKYGIMLIDDEVQMGWGRSGKIFCIELWNVTPDIVASGKSITGGVIPMAVVIAEKKVMDTFKPNQQSVTFAGTPVGCAVGIALIELLKNEKLLEHATEKGKYLLNGLKDLQNRHPLIGLVDGRGLMIGIEFVKDRVSKEPATNETKIIMKESMKKGLVLNVTGYYGNRINIVPPLIIEKDQIDKALKILDEVLYMVEKK
jgi:4-aminobutyrate aminotransferase